jgi:dTDP-4-amino-4,6-dideoxygalactose transaminase
MGGGEEQYVKQAFENNWIAPLGPNVTGFEEDLQKYLGSNSNVAVLSSGTAAIHLGLILLGVKAGDEVLCQSMTFSATANPIVYLGATPIFIDSEEDTWNMSPAYLEEAIIDRISKKGEKPKVIIPVHLYGMPAKMDEIKAISEKYNIPILEDAAEALGSSINGQNCGTFGEMACLSFNGNKIITTSGGGALVAKEKMNTDRAIFLATQARDTAPHYQHSQIGYNYRMSNICAGIGRGQMEILNKHIALRRANFEFYRKGFGEVSPISFLEEKKGYFSNRWLSVILVNPENGVTRETIRLALDDENIESRPLWKPMHLQPVFSNSPYYGAKISEELFNNGLCLPSGSNLQAVELKRIVNVILRIFEKAMV